MIDNALPSLSPVLLRELTWLSSTTHMQPNRTSFGSALFAKPGIWEADMHDDRVRQLVELPGMRTFASSCEDLLARLRLHYSGGEELSDAGAAEACSVKLQFNTGQLGCFPAHYDNPGQPNRRALTCILYLNEEWEAGHGGELTLFPFLSLSAPPQKKIPPLFGRLVIFQSNTMLHRVEQCHHPRFAITVWIDGKDTNSSEKTQLSLPASIYDDAATFAATVQKLQKTPLQRCVSRALYREVYEQSLAECMHDAASEEGLRLMLAAHEQHLRAVAHNPALAKFVDALRAYADGRLQQRERGESADSVD